MKFDLKELPYVQFAQLGLSQRDVITMIPEDLAGMLNGRRSGLLPLTITLGRGMNPIQAEAKLSLIRNPANTVSLNVHFILSQPKNTIDATPEQWEKLLNGELVRKDAKALNGTLEPHIYQVDKPTNEVLSIRVNSIQIPNYIQNTLLTPKQKEQLKQGHSLE